MVPTYCSSIFIAPQEWMRSQLSEEQTGRLMCPNPKCSQKLGAYSYYGAQCSCGKFVCPAYQIIKSNIDEAARIQIIGIRKPKIEEDAPRM